MIESIEGPRLKAIFFLLITLLLPLPFSMFPARGADQENALFNGSLGASDSEPANVTTHEGDLIIDQELLIENCTYIQTGNIFVRGYGKLTITNVPLVMAQEYPFQYELSVSDYGQLLMEKVAISSEFATWLVIRDDSVASVSASYVVGLIADGDARVDIVESTVVELHVSGSSRVTASDSIVSYDVYLSLRQASSVVVNGLRPGLFNNWNVHANITVSGIDYDLTLLRTRVDGWFLWFNLGTAATVSDSTISRVKIDLELVSAVLDGVKRQYYDVKEIGKVRLLRTSVTEGFVIDAVDSTVRITDSEIHGGVRGNSQLYMENTVVEPWFWAIDFYGDISLENCMIGGFFFQGSDFSISGNSRFSSARIYAWVSSRVDKFSNVVVHDGYEKAISEAFLALTTEDYTPVWTGKPDSEGKAVIPLSFDDGNHTGTMRLLVSGIGRTMSTTIGFLSDTPVVLVLDNRPPDVTIITPLNGSKVQGMLEVYASAWDNVGVEKVEFYLDNKLQATVPGGTRCGSNIRCPMMLRMDSTTLQSGLHTVKAIAYDASNNSNSTLIVIDVQNPIPPSSTLTTTTIPPTTTTTPTPLSLSSVTVCVTALILASPMLRRRKRR